VKTLLWDFDGTLAHRPVMWRGCLLEVLDEHEPSHAATAEAIAPFLRDGFPWHRPDQPHPELADPDAWWTQIEPLFESAYCGVGLSPERAAALARLVRPRYVDQGWQLFADTIPALTKLQDRGWQNVILSNHVPELPAIVDGLGLSPFISTVVTSAASGFEKPHREAFAGAVAACGATAPVWMIGDSYPVDIIGAHDAGIPAILVRTHDERADPGLTSLEEVVAFLADAPALPQRVSASSGSVASDST
jgi:putative hydrolase of the HAD superfamily